MGRLFLKPMDRKTIKTKRLPCLAAPVSTAYVVFTALCLFASSYCCYALELDIVTWKSEYVLGEPVVLTVFVKNATKEPLRVWPDAIRHQMLDIELSEDGKHFRALEIFGRIVNVGTASVTLQPGGEKRIYLPYLGFREVVQQSSEREKGRRRGSRVASFFEASRTVFCKDPIEIQAVGCHRPFECTRRAALRRIGHCLVENQRAGDALLSSVWASIEV